jgi:hypothetical protein
MPDHEIIVEMEYVLRNYAKLFLNSIRDHYPYADHDTEETLSMGHLRPSLPPISRPRMGPTCP